MQKIATVIDRELKWEQPGAFKQLYELRTTDGLVATLTFPNSFRCNATGQSADGCWDFQREGRLGGLLLQIESGQLFRDAQDGAAQVRSSGQNRGSRINKGPAVS